MVVIYITRYAFLLCGAGGCLNLLVVMKSSYGHLYRKIRLPAVTRWQLFEPACGNPVQIPCYGLWSIIPTRGEPRR